MLNLLVIRLINFGLIQLSAIPGMNPLSGVTRNEQFTL